MSANAASERVKDAENKVIQDVRLALMDRSYAEKRLELTAKLLASANKAYKLAQQRYEVGSSSIVELSQAQLNQTEAKIGQAKAGFELQVRNAILSYQIGKTLIAP